MRTARMYLRSRLADYALLGLALAALLSWAGTAWLLSKPYYSVQGDGLEPLLVVGTLGAACVVGASAYSPFGDVERTVALPLPPVRLAHLAGLILCATLALAAAVLAFDLTGAQPTDPLFMLLRNLAGLSGLALITARLAGSQLSWTLPLAFTAVVHIAGSNPNDEPYPWAWTIQPGADGLSWALALTLLVAGLGAACLTRERNTAGGE